MRPESNRIALSISIVLFKPDVALLMRTLDSVRAAIGRLRVRYGALPVCVWLVNNENMPLSEHWSDACKGRRFSVRLFKATAISAMVARIIWRLSARVVNIT